MIKDMYVFALKHIFRNRGKTALVVVAVSTASVLLMFSLITFFAENYSYNSLNGILTKGIERTGTVRIIDTEGDILVGGQKLLDDLLESDIISSGGSLSWGNTSGLDELKRLSGDNTDLLYINCDAFNLCPFKLSQGTYPDEINNDLFDNIMHLYLGNNFKGKVELGKEYRTEEGMVFKVVGFTAPDSKWLDTSVCVKINSQQLNYDIPLDSAVIVVEECLSSDSFLFNIDGNKNINKTKSEIINFAKGRGYTVSVQTLDEIFKDSNEEYVILQTFALRMLFVVLFSSIVIITSFHLELLITNRRNFGKMYAVGFSQKQILLLHFFELLICGVTEIIISALAGALITYLWFRGTAFADIGITLFVHKVIPIAILMIVCISVVSSVLPTVLFKRLTPSELIGG